MPFFHCRSFVLSRRIYLRRRSSEIALNFSTFLLSPNFTARAAQIGTQLLKLYTNHAAEFCGHWPKDLGVYAVKKRKKDETSAVKR